MKKGLLKDALIKILEYNASLEIKDLNMPSPEDYRKVIYFGDSTNDIELLKECEISIARGKKGKKVAMNAKYYYNDLDEFSNALFASMYEQKNKMEKLSRLDSREQ